MGTGAGRSDIDAHQRDTEDKVCQPSGIEPFLVGTIIILVLRTLKTGILTWYSQYRQKKRFIDIASMGRSTPHDFEMPSVGLEK